MFRRFDREWDVTNNDDHPRNHAFLQTTSGWRLSPAYDIVPAPLLSQGRRDLALTTGTFGRAASLYSLLSRCDVFGLTHDEAQQQLSSTLAVVQTWREFFARLGVEQRSIEMLEQAILPQCFFHKAPPQDIQCFR